MVKLYTMDGSEEGQSFDLTGDSVYIGRGPDNDVQMRDRSVSRRHLKILRRGDKYFVVDLKSENGTFVDGQLIPPGVECEIKEGIAISLGLSVVCMGKGCIEGVMTFLDSVYLPEEGRKVVAPAPHSRTMTPQKNMELMYKVSDIFSKSLDINEILEKILNYILDHLKRIDRGYVILIDEKTGKISDVPSIPKKSCDDTIMMYSRSIVHRVLRDGEAVMMSDTLCEDKSDRSESMELMKIRSVMCVPLVSRSKIRGVIYVDSVNKPYGFRNEDLSLLTALSNPAAIAIENASLFSTLEKVVPFSANPPK